MRLGLVRAVLLAACALTACDSGGNAAPPTLGTAPPAVSMPPTTTAPPPTTTAASAAPASLPPGTVELSPDGPWRRVDSAPGITQPGLTYELMEGLWVWLPTVEDLPNGINWVLNEEDLPVIEAYLQARLVFYEAIAAEPMEFSSEGWDRWYVDGGSRLKAIFVPRGQEGYAADLSAGVVLRPSVAGEGRTESAAIVLDCAIDGAVLRDSAGNIGEGSTEGVTIQRLASSMVLAEIGWQLDRITDGGSAACA